MEERCSELASVSPARRGRGEEGAGRMRKENCLPVSKGNKRQMELEGAVWGEGCLCSPLLLRKNLPSWGTKHEKRESISPLKEVGSVLPAETTGLAGAQALLRHRKRPWTNQASSKPILLTPFSKNYNSWSKSHPFSRVNTISSNGKARSEEIIFSQEKWK